MNKQTGASPEAVRQGARHKLFVEGKADSSLDPIVLSELLPEIAVVALGPSRYVHAASKALHPHHPDYYFLIDRDTATDEEVESSWATFPDPAHSNLLIWRKHELESYFVDPDYLKRSSYLTCGEVDLRARILHGFQERLYMEAANRVLSELREGSREHWLSLFTNPTDFPTKESAVTSLLAITAPGDWLRAMKARASAAALEVAFNSHLHFLAGGAGPLEYGTGTWLGQLGAKQILSTVVNECFRVVVPSGDVLHGGEAVRLVARDLLHRVPIDEQPADFRSLKQLVSRVAAT